MAGRCARREEDSVVSDQPAASPRKTPGRRRMNADEPRTNRVVVKCTDDELRMLFGLAASQGVSIQNALMRAALAGDAETAARTADLARELRDTRHMFSVATGLLNQLAKVANSTGEMPAEVADALEYLERSRRRVDGYLEDFGDRWNESGRRGAS